MPTLPVELAFIILAFRPLFSQRVWDSAYLLLMGAILAPSKRTVTSALRIMGLAEERHFQNYHRTLNRAVWSCRHAGLILLRMLLTTFVPSGPLVLGLDDTIERRWGARIRARGIYRDPVRSSDSHFVKTSGLRWLSLMLLADIPWAGRVWALPFLTALAPSERYWQKQGRNPKHLTDWARQLVLQVQRWFPARTLVVVADGAFASLQLLSVGGTTKTGSLYHSPATGRSPVSACPPAQERCHRPTTARRNPIAFPAAGPCQSSYEVAAAVRRGLVWAGPASHRTDFRHRRLVSHWPAASAYPLGPGAGSKGQIRNSRTALHSARPASSPNSAVVPVALASGGDIPGSTQSSRSGDPTSMVRFRHRTHYASLAGTLFDRDVTGTSSGPQRSAPDSPVCLVSQDAGHLLGCYLRGAPATLASCKFLHFPF
jgi:hypothetical protein